MFWYEFKLLIAHLSGVSMDALHVVVGVTLHLLLALLLRMPLARWTPWLLLLGLEVLNEALDVWVERWPHPGMQWGEGLRDLLLTMTLPSLFLLVARLRPQLFSGANLRE